MIVTIDGPAGSGKSTAARMLAKRLGYRFLDTGAMYRAIALDCLLAGLAPADQESVAARVATTELEFANDSLLLNGVDVTGLIRTPDVSAMSSVVAVNPVVRDRLVAIQRQIAAGKNIVSEGRDQGTVVFPDAECKFFVTASAEQRAERRHAEMLSHGEEVPYEEILQTIIERDERDANRSIAPLKPAEDAIVIDTSDLSLDDVVEQLEEAVRRHAT